MANSGAELEREKNIFKNKTPSMQRMAKKKTKKANSRESHHFDTSKKETFEQCGKKLSKDSLSAENKKEKKTQKKDSRADLYQNPTATKVIPQKRKFAKQRNT